MKTRNSTISKKSIEEQKELDLLKFGGKVIIGDTEDFFDNNTVLNVKLYYKRN